MKKNIGTDSSLKQMLLEDIFEVLKLESKNIKTDLWHIKKFYYTF